MTRHDRIGLTLIEILAVLAVLGTLLAILLPAVQSSRAAASRTQCQSNLRQWAHAAHMYADLHGGFLPRRGQGVQPTTQFSRPQDWFNALPPLMNERAYSELRTLQMTPTPGDGGVWTCPVAQGTDSVGFFSYAMNMGLSPWDRPKPDHLEKVGATHTLVFMADAPGPNCSTWPSKQAYSPAARHGQTVNLAFVDGHVAAYPGDEIGCGAGDPHRDDVHWQVSENSWSEPAR